MRSPPTRRRESRHFWKNGARVGREGRVFLRVVLLKPKSLDHEHCERSSTIAPVLLRGSSFCTGSQIDWHRSRTSCACRGRVGWILARRDKVGCDPSWPRWGLQPKQGETGSCRRSKQRPTLEASPGSCPEVL